MTKWDRSSYISAWETEAQLFRQAVGDADLTQPTPDCPGWTLHDLVEHMVELAGRITRRLLSESAPDAAADAADAEHDGSVLDQFDAAMRELSAVMTRVELDDSSWNFAPQANTARYWFRHAACMTAVHRWDAQQAVESATAIDAALAAEGVEEVVSARLPSGKRHAASEVSGVVELVAADADRQWFVRLRGDRVALLDAPSVDPDELRLHTRAVGTASDLFLALWGRIPFDAVEFDGDPDLLAALRTS